MEIKGKFKYVETKPEKKIEKDIFSVGSENHGFANNISKTKPVIESKYFNDNRDILFAIKPLNTADKIKHNFLRQLKKLKFFDKSIIDYIDKIDSEKLVKLQYFDVFFCKVLKYTYETKSTISHYKKTGEYTVETSDDGKTYDVTPKYERYTTSLSVVHSKDANELIHCSQFDKGFYITKAIDQSLLVSDEDLPGLDYYESENVNNVAALELKAESVKELQLIQILLFPIWKIEFEFDGEKYSTYLSDVSGKMILKRGDTTPKTILPVLLTKQIKARKIRKNLSYGILLSLSYMFMFAGLSVILFYGIAALVHAGDLESWTWFFIHLFNFCAAGTFLLLTFQQTSNLKNEKNVYLRSSKLAFFYSLLGLLLLAAGFYSIITFQ